MQRSKIPNFIFIGAPRCGSTWFFEALQAHPEVYVPPAKDIYFFDKYYNKGTAWYLKFFKGAPPGVKAIGEVSHDYLYSDEAAKRIKKDFPKVKIIACLRNPTKRAFSEYLFCKPNISIKGNFKETLERIPDILWRGKYAEHIQRYYDIFGKNNCKVFFFDELENDPDLLTRNLYEFIGVDPSFIFRDANKKILPSSRARIFWISRIAKKTAKMLRKLGFINILGRIKYSFIRGMLFAKLEKTEKDAMSSTDADWLYGYYRSDVKKLQSILGSDLLKWLTKPSAEPDDAKKKNIHSKIKNWIYVTGAPRSGTTFTGYMLSIPRNVDYLHEPFNNEVGMSAIKQSYIYTRKGLSNEQETADIVNSIKNYTMILKNGIFPNDGLSKKIFKTCIGSRAKIHYYLARTNPFHDTTVVKDPTGVFLTKYLVENFGFKTIALVRHPAAMVSSFLRCKWSKDLLLTPLRAQKDFVRDQFADEPNFLFQAWNNDIEAIAVSWRIVYKVLFRFAKETKNILLVTHEELCEDSIGVFKRLYAYCNLPWSIQTERKIKKLTSTKNRIQTPKMHDFKRDSKKLFQVRLNQLTKEERRRIYEITGEVAEKFYPRETFML